MARSEELRIVSIETPSLEDDGFFFMSDKRTGQISFEPLEKIHIDSKTKTLAYFSAKSLGRRVRGFVGYSENNAPHGEVDFVTPLKPGEFEQF